MLHPTRPATHSDLPYLLHLQRVFSDQIGFVPTNAYAIRIDRGDLIVTTENDDPAAFALACCRLDRTTHISQVAVDLDLHRNLHGAALLARIAARSHFAGSTRITCTVRDNIPAHAFWRALGFQPMRVRHGGKARRRMLIDYSASVDSVSIATADLLAPETRATLTTPVGG